MVELHCNPPTACYGGQADTGTAPIDMLQCLHHWRLSGNRYGCKGVGGNVPLAPKYSMCAHNMVSTQHAETSRGVPRIFLLHLNMYMCAHNMVSRQHGETA